MVFHPRLLLAARILGDFKGITADFISVAGETTRAFSALHRKTKSIEVGDMVVIRMGDSRRGTEAFTGRSGMVVYKNTNPVWSKYSVLIDQQRISFAIDEIEKC